jgi:hypothetical protein
MYQITRSQQWQKQNDYVPVVRTIRVSGLLAANFACEEKDRCKKDKVKKAEGGSLRPRTSLFFADGINIVNGNPIVKCFPWARG